MPRMSCRAQLYIQSSLFPKDIGHLIDPRAGIGLDRHVEIPDHSSQDQTHLRQIAIR